jgi:hypothetical protein
MFKVVEDQEYALTNQRCPEALTKGLVSGLSHTER